MKVGMHLRTEREPPTVHVEGRGEYRGIEGINGLIRTLQTARNWLEIELAEEEKRRNVASTP